VLALVTCRAALGLDADLPLLQRELPSATVAAWDDPSIDWGSFSVAVVRSTWDYHVRRDEFLRWARHVGEVSTLWNSFEVIEWNTDKRYLTELADHGVPTVPTMFLDDADHLDHAALTGDVVVKPSVGTGSNGVLRSRGDEAAARVHADALISDGLTAMVQPYLADVETAGETGLVYLGGAFSHAFRKAAILAEPVEFEGDLMALETSRPHVATVAERSLGDRIVELLPETAYARIDLLPTVDGPVLLEVELTEPSLFLQHDPGAAARAAAVFRNLAV
jgi:glutathione synthase/RimK-type ligase-like ATP-grasp enzyme